MQSSHFSQHMASRNTQRRTWVMIGSLLAILLFLHREWTDDKTNNSPSDTFTQFKRPQRPVPLVAPDIEDPEEPQLILNDPVLFMPSRRLVDEAKAYKPHNYPNKKGFTFATLLCTRDESIHDIYFHAARALIHRFLWFPSTASLEIPMTVFVAPFVPQWKRDILQAEGANVVELPLIEITPTKTNFNSERWRDQYTKLHMWNQTQFSTIVYLDSDAFPIHPIDEVFTVAKVQQCKAEMLDAIDSAHADEICDYLFAGVPILDYPEVGVNGGLLVFKPEIRMHQRLLRLAPQTDLYDNELMEQGLFEFAYRWNSTFPAQQLKRKWNGVFPGPTEASTLNVVHQKWWNKAYASEGLEWMCDMWDENWKAMQKFYTSKEFLHARRLDHLAGLD